MITLTKDQLEKIDLLDSLFNAFDVRQLKEFTESEQVVATLRGSESELRLLREIADTHNKMINSISILDTDSYSIKSDFIILLRAVSALTVHIDGTNQSGQSVHNSYELQNLKNKYGVF